MKGFVNRTVEVYPNPSTGIVNVVFGNAEVADYVLFNAMGQQVAMGKFIGQEQENILDMSLLPAGVYLLKVRTAVEFFTK